MLVHSPSGLLFSVEVFTDHSFSWILCKSDQSWLAVWDKMSIQGDTHGLSELQILDARRKRLLHLLWNYSNKSTFPSSRFFALCGCLDRRGRCDRLLLAVILHPSDHRHS